MPNTKVKRHSPRLICLMHATQPDFCLHINSNSVAELMLTTSTRVSVFKFESIAFVLSTTRKKSASAFMRYSFMFGFIFICLYSNLPIFDM